MAAKRNDDLPCEPWGERASNPTEAIATALTLLRELVIAQRHVAEMIEGVRDEIYHQNRT